MSAPDQDTQAFYEGLVEESLRQYLNWNQTAVFYRVEPQDVISEALHGQCRHILQNGHPYFAEDLNMSARILRDPNSLVASPLITILGDGHTGDNGPHIIFEQDFNESGQKSDILARIEGALTNGSVSSSVRSEIIMVADELFTNAVYNAPFVDLENISSGAPRDLSSVKMPDGKTGHFVLAADAKRVLVGCKDDFGTLNVKKFLERIKNCYDAGVAATMRLSGQGGAGIGSFMIFNSSASTLIDVKQREYTAVYCVFPIKMSSRVRNEIPKNLFVGMRK